MAKLKTSVVGAVQLEPPNLFCLAGIAKQFDIDAIEAEMLVLAVSATNPPSYPSEIGLLAQPATQKLLRKHGNDLVLAKPWTCPTDSLAHTATVGRCGSLLAQDSPDSLPLA